MYEHTAGMLLVAWLLLAPSVLLLLEPAINGRNR